MGHAGKIATHVLLAFVALLAGRYLVIDMPFTRDTLLQATKVVSVALNDLYGKLSDEQKEACSGVAPVGRRAVG